MLVEWIGALFRFLFSRRTKAEMDPNSAYVKFDENGKLLDETGSTLWKELNRAYDASNNEFAGQPTPIMRYKPPYNRIAVFDMKGDAVQLVVDSILNNDLPYYVAYVVGVDMVTKLNEELGIEFVEFIPDANEGYITDGAGAWAKRISDMVPTYCKRFIRGEVRIQDRSPAWYQIQVSCYSNKGKRKTQEDKYLCLPSLDVHHPGIARNIPLFAVFDGHNGSQIASYAAAHLPFEFGFALKQEADVTAALTNAMTTLDKRIEARTTVEPWRSIGATAVVAAVTPSDIHIRWLGDSPAFIMTSTVMQKVTEEHNAHLDREIERVKEAGGEFIWRDGENRVQGVLSVSRALGDVSMRPAISGDPDELIIPRERDQYLLMLVCDGITDVFKPKDLFSQVERYVMENDPDEYAEMAEHIVQAAIEAGSVDNCTCVIAFLKTPKELWKLFEQDDEDSD